MCTDVLVASKDKKQVVNARSQEFNGAVGYRLMVRQPGRVDLTMPTKTSTKKGWSLDPSEPETFHSRHAYIGLMMTTPLRDGAIPISTAVFDGMNSAGLSVGCLLFPGAEYQKKQDGTNNVFIGFFVDWLLSNYATCEQVRKAFSSNELRVVFENKGGFNKEEIEKNLGQHFAVHDAVGNSLVVEFIKGNLELNDNPVGVLTNLPSFPWHLTNLGLYARLSNFDTSRAVYFGVGDAPEKDEDHYDGPLLKYAPPGSPSAGPLDGAPFHSTGIPGVGDGLSGIPGDFRPASRFVRIAYLNHFAVAPKTGDEAVAQAFHLLNSIDIVKGVAAEKDKEGHVTYDTAQCVVVKDLINKVFYVRMYDSPMPYSISFDDVRNWPDDGKGIQMTIPAGSLAQPLSANDRYQTPEPALVLA